MASTMRPRPPRAAAPPTQIAAGTDGTDLRARRLRDAWFMLGVLALGVVTLLVLTTMGNAVSQRASPPRAQATRSSTATVPAAAGGASLPGVQSAQTRTFSVAPANAGLMQPSVDAAGNVWFGEMS